MGIPNVSMSCYLNIIEFIYKRLLDEDPGNLSVATMCYLKTELILNTIFKRFSIILSEVVFILCLHKKASFILSLIYILSDLMFILVDVAIALALEILCKNLSLGSSLSKLMMPILNRICNQNLLIIEKKYKAAGPLTIRLLNVSKYFIYNKIPR